MSFTFGELDAITEKFYQKELYDNIFNSNPIIKRFYDKKEMVDGGLSLIVPIIKSSSSNNGFYNGRSDLDLSETEDITAAQFNWKYLAEVIKISQIDLNNNSGKAQQLSLLKSKIKIAEKNVKDKLGTGLFSDGTGFSIDGFKAMISETSTYGNIQVSDLATWVSQVEDNGAVLRSLTLPLMNLGYSQAVIDEEKPTMATGSKAVLRQVWALFQPAQRLMSEEMSKLGFSNVLEFNGIPVIEDSHNVESELLFINENHAFLKVHNNGDLRTVSHDALEKVDAMVRKMFWQGNLVCSNRRLHSKVSDIAIV